MKNIYFKTILLFSSLVLFSVCKKQEAPPTQPEYYENEAFAKPFSHKTTISLQSDIKVNYKDAIVGSALMMNFVPLACRPTTFSMVVPFTEHYPGKYYNVYPNLNRDFIIKQIPLSTGKVKIVNSKYGVNINCQVDTLPHTDMYWSQDWRNEVILLTKYILNPQDDNFVELTAVDTIVKHEVLGNIKVKFLQNAPRSKAYPDTINITASFKIDW